jgi:chloramphenicol-sensitive protein RarD
LLPLYFLILSPAGPVEIVANRVLWSSVFCVALLTALKSWGRVRVALRTPRMLGTLTISALLIAVNWLVYTYGAVSGQVMEASLGYFINPIVSVLLGVVFLRERLRPLQWAAISLGTISVLVLAIGHGSVPWIALTLAFSFGFYGFLKKVVGSKVDTLSSLSIETVLLLPLAVGVIIWLEWTGSSSLFTEGASHFWAMVASGVVTVVPLFFFGAAASRLPLATVGLLQYLTPALQFVLALLVFGEEMAVERWVGYGLIWAGLVLLTLDAYRAVRYPPCPADDPDAVIFPAAERVLEPADSGRVETSPYESCRASRITQDPAGAPAALGRPDGAV